MTNIDGRSLDPPILAAADPRGREIARVWAAQDRVHTTIRTGIWEDPATWGVFLVDFARQLADAYHKTKGSDEATTLRRIRQAFDAEWNDQVANE